MRRLQLSVLALVAAAGAFAHDLYLMPEQFHVPGGTPATIGVHNGDAFPESTETPPMARLQDASVHAAGKASAGTGLRADGKRAVFSIDTPRSGHFFATIIAAANTISMEPGEFLEYLNEESLTHVIDIRARQGEAQKPARERYTKYSKTILLAGQGDGGFNRVLGLPIEFIPEADPFAVKPGGTLPVRVLLRGSPAANLHVIAASSGAPDAKPRGIGRTGADGRIAIPITGAGKWRLHTIQMERSADAVADWESLWATLTFEVR